MSDTVPTEFPATSTWSPETIWLAFWKIALTLYVGPPDSRITTTAPTATAIAAIAATRPITVELRTDVTSTLPIDLLPPGVGGNPRRVSIATLARGLMQCQFRTDRGFAAHHALLHPSLNRESDNGTRVRLWAESSAWAPPMQ